MNKVHSKIPSESPLIWVDMEMSGLNSGVDHIIEIALVITNNQLQVLAQAPVLVIYQPDSVLENMDAWNKKMHTRSGLIERVRASTIDILNAQQQLLEFIKPYVAQGRSPMCGNSICQDRRFMARLMPDLEHYFHYRNLDVSTLKELCRRWQPKLYQQFKKKSAHTALADIYESIEELKFYRAQFIRQDIA